MKKEIRKDVREYILSQVNETLARLGVSEQVVETETWEDKYRGTLHYKFKSAPIRQMPMMFKAVVVEGYMVSIELEEGDRLYEYTEENDLVVVNLDYSWQSFSRGTNGTEIGRMIFAVSKKLPETENSKYLEYAIYKLEGLSI